MQTSPPISQVVRETLGRQDLSFHRLPRVLAARAVKKTKHYQDIADGLWTDPVRLGKRTVAWPAHEVTILNAAATAGATPEELRDIVKQLHTERKNALSRITGQHGHA